MNILAIDKSLIGFLIVEAIGLLPIGFYFLIPKEDIEIRKAIFKLVFRSVIAMVIGVILYFTVDDYKKVMMIIIAIQFINWFIFHRRK